MGTQSRQFIALMRKNGINWRRRAGCSLCELCCPAVLMLILVAVRYSIVVNPDQPASAQLESARPTMPGFPYQPKPFDKETYHWDVLASGKVASEVTPWMLQNGHVAEGETYKIDRDSKGPIQFLPQDCFKISSFTQPKVAMPVIAVVSETGEEYDEHTGIMVQYLQKQINTISDLPIPSKYRQLLPQFYVKTFTSEQDLFDYTSAEDYLQPDGKDGVCYGFHFTKSDGAYDLSLYFNDQQLFSGKEAVGIPYTQNPAYNPTQKMAMDEGYSAYLTRGYSVLQNLAANIALKLESGQKETAFIGLYNAPFPAPVKERDSFIRILTASLPFFILLMLVPPVYNMVHVIVQEKESRTKESMRMMGMRDCTYWLSWYAYYSLVSLVVVTLAWFVLIWNVVQYSNLFLLWVFFFLYGQSVFGQIVFLQSLFGQAKYSGIFATLIYFGCTLFSIPIIQLTSNPTAKLLLSVFPQVAMQQTCAIFGFLEGGQVGLSFSNATEFFNNYSFARGLYMLVVSDIVFLLLGFYLDKVLPRAYGERKSCCFCFRRRARPTEPEHGAGSNSEQRNLEPEMYEAVPPEVARLEELQQVLSVEGLRKEYANGTRAVDGVNLKLYSGQIFALLGHNGAGKSTTISLLTGLIDRSEGRASIFDRDLFGQMEDVRRMMGVCPQHDVLFPYLTPQEHLEIFYDFKGADPAAKQDEIARLLLDVGLSLDVDKEARALSGGNQRKLSVAIALCGGSRLVILDEPTAGMDINARRALWEMLKSYRANRIILLTTHYMDEADVLGDRVAIMSAGRVKCLGSPLFLKNRYGSGFKLTLVKQSPNPSPRLWSFIESHLGRVEKLSEVTQEVSFKIPLSKKDNLREFFNALDENLEQLEVRSYGVSMASLEEVFLRVNGAIDSSGSLKASSMSGPHINKTADGSASELKNSAMSSNTMRDSSVRDSEVSRSSLLDQNLIGQGGSCQQMRALFSKRYHIYKRDKTGICCEVLVPTILAILGLCLLQVPWTHDSPAYLLDTSAFPGPQRITLNENTIVGADTGYSPQELFANFVDSGSYFEAEYTSDQDYTPFFYGLTDIAESTDPEPPRFGAYQIYKADKEKQIYEVNFFANTTSNVAVPYFHQFMYQSILKTAVGVEFNVRTAPFPMFYVFELQAASQQSIIFSIIVGIALSIIPCVIISFIIQERQRHLKHIQMVSGVNLLAYWTSNMISDIIQTYIPIAFILLFTLVFGLQYDGIWMSLVAYPVCVVPFTYFTSFFFTSDVLAQIFTFSVHFLGGSVLPLVVWVLQNIPNTIPTGDNLRWGLTIFPTFSVCYSIVFSATCNLLAIARRGINLAYHNEFKPVTTDVYELKNLTGTVLVMLAVGLLCTLLLFIAEADIFQFFTRCSLCPRKLEDRGAVYNDDDVMEEERRIVRQQADPNDDETGESVRDVVQVFRFNKTYQSLLTPPFVAVENVSFGLDYGECFALLGENGAGKSTTFKSLTRNVVPTSGSISVGGYSVTKEFSQARKKIGYCPQQDAIFPLMTVEEHLLFFARIKGIPKEHLETVVSKTMQRLQLYDQRKKPAGTLSGGTKRKLSVAIALLGNPPIVLLDEPSAGMDPEARRFMWSVVEQITRKDRKSAVVLTTHSMEEAEALSTKMAIMTRGGRFRCFGSAQHVRSKFATGYEVEFKIRAPTSDELTQLASQIGFQLSSDAVVKLDAALTAMAQRGIDQFIIGQIFPGGLGSELHFEAAMTQGNVRLMSLLQFLFAKQNAFRLISALVEPFAEVELLEQCGNFFRLRVPSQSQSIGFLFGLLEANREPCMIQESGVTQTTLEQIFQRFANFVYADKGAKVFVLDGKRRLALRGQAQLTAASPIMVANTPSAGEAQPLLLKGGQ